MSLAGLEMVFFLPLALAAYWLGPRRAGWQNAVLALASVIFYLSWNPRLLAVLVAAILASYGAGAWLGALPTEGLPEAEAGVVRRRRRRVLTLALVAQLGLLGVFKYAGFFADSLNALLGAVGIDGALPILRLALPLGISYTTLVQVGYLLEVYWERAPACRDPLAYGVFVGFFPQLLAGPIVRARAMLPQYLVPRRLAADDVAAGAAALLLGFTMKAFVADWLSPRVVDPVFAHPATFATRTLWVGLLGYATQLFSDFAGYSLMALGTGRLFGLALPENFRHPFLSKSLAELWRRWHISLNTWLFDYLFAPLTTGRSWFRGRTGAGFLVVFLVSGLWHGATWTFVLWGLAHGVALAGHHAYDGFYKGLCRKDRAWVARRKSRGYGLASWVVTQLFFVLTLVPFRAPSLAAAVDFGKGLVGLGGSGRLAERFGLQAAAITLFFVAYHLLEVGPGPRWLARFRALPAAVRGVAYGLVVAFLMVYTPLGASTFIYAQF